MFLQSGLTPLSLAASKNHNDAVEFLVSKTNADLNTTNQVSEYYGQLHNIVIYVATSTCMECSIASYVGQG